METQKVTCIGCRYWGANWDRRDPQLNEWPLNDGPPGKDVCMLLSGWISARKVYPPLKALVVQPHNVVLSPVADHPYLWTADDFSCPHAEPTRSESL